MVKLSRNDPCTCGSGKKYKKCCLNQIQTTSTLDFSWHKMRETDKKIDKLLSAHFAKTYPEEIILYAWEEFFVYSEDLPDIEENENMLVENAFMPWLFYNWMPDPAENDQKHYPEITIAEDYLNKYPERLNDYEKRFIQANLKANFSLYEIIGVVPQKSLTLRDILCNQTIKIHEKHGSEKLKMHDLIMARVMTLENHSIAVGTHTSVVPPQFQSDLIDFKHHFAQGGDFTQSMIFELDLEIREIFMDIVDYLTHNALPNLQNTDGENYVMNDLYFELLCSPQEAFDKLADIAKGIPKEDLLQSAVYDGGDLIEIEFPWCRLENKIHKDWSNTVLGHVKIQQGKILVNVNSDERAEVIRALIGERLTNKVKDQVTQIQTVEQMFKASSKHKTESVDINDPEIQALLQDFNRKHWESWPDMSLPALGGKTPREAVKSKMGREKVEALLASFHSSNQRSQSPVLVDLHMLRKELDIL